MKEVLLLKCGEIVLKGLNRKTFEDRLLKNLKRRMAHVADCEITMRQSVVYVEIPDDADADAVMECASRVFDHLPRGGMSGKDARECHCDRKGLSGTQFCGG